MCGEVKNVMGVWQFDESDIERLSTIMTLHDIGFTNAEIENICACSFKERIQIKKEYKCWKVKEEEP